MITRFVFVFTRFHSFNCFKIEFWSFASFLHSLDFILSPAPNLNFNHLIGFLYWLDFILVTDLRLNFDNLFRFYIHLNSFFPRLWYLILVMCFVFTFTWIRYFNRYERFFINDFFCWLDFFDLILSRVCIGCDTLFFDMCILSRAPLFPLAVILLYLLNYFVWVVT